MAPSALSCAVLFSVLLLLVVVCVCVCALAVPRLCVEKHTFMRPKADATFSSHGSAAMVMAAPLSLCFLTN